MSRLMLFFTMVMTLLVLTACGAAETAQPDAAAIDLAALPQTLDVQTVAAVKDRDDVLVLDVREPHEYAAGHIPGVTLIPMGEVAGRLNEIPSDQPVIITCRSGNRSQQVADYLRQNGYTNVHNMAGGIVEWEAAGLPVEQ